MFHRTFIIIFLYLSLMGLQSIELYDRLNYLIGYVKIHEESQNPDLMLGIYVCEAQLKTMVGNESASSIKMAKVLENVKNVRENYENRIGKHSIWESNVHNSIVVQHLLNLNFWVTSLQTISSGGSTLFFGNLSGNYAFSLTLENFSEIIDCGQPTPTQSDECLAELLNSNQCMISGRCLQIMSLNSESHGYHLTHKLLYFMLVKYRNCDSYIPVDGTSLDYMIYVTCALIWHERNLIIEMDIPKQLRDLFLEQTLLCGMNGYAAFTDEILAREVVEWQAVESGCYEYFDGTLPVDSGKKLKRHAVSLKDNCSDHATGLATAAFGLFAKISNHFQNYSI